MFKATVESLSHEGGLLAPFTGSSPALGSIIVRTDDGTYIGKIDGVLGNTDSPIAHIAHLDRKMNPNDFIGCEAQIRPKAPREDNRDNRNQHRNPTDNSRQSYNRDRNQGGYRSSHGQSFRRDSRNRHERSYRDNQSRPNRRDNSRSDNWRNRRGDGRDNNQRRDSNRPNQRGNHRGRDFSNRDSRDSRGQKKIFADNDWVCQKCDNVNFSFRKECNRCGEPKMGNSGRDKPPRRHNNQTKTRPERPNNNNRKFRKARGKSANHAHNRGPQPLNARSRRKNRDD